MNYKYRCVNEIRIPTPLGTLIATPTPDAEYPGIAIDIEDKASKIIFPLNHAEYDPESKTIISRVWGNAMQEDYTDRVEHINLRKMFDAINDEKDAVLHEQSPIAYICSPYGATSDTTVEENIQKAKTYGRFAIAKGYVPFIAHVAVCGFLDDANPVERETGILMDIRFIDNCDELWVFGDRISKGMSAEIEHSRKNHVPIRYFTTDLVETNYELT